MLAEKFVLYLEALIKDRSHGTPAYTDVVPHCRTAVPNPACQRSRQRYRITIS
jgi:hypothetical protein